YAWVLTGALVPLSFVAWTSSNQLSGVLRFGLTNVLFTASRVAYMLGVLLLVAAAGFGVVAGLAAAALASLVMAVGSLAALLPHGRPRLDRSIARSMLSYGSRNQVALVFQTLNYRLDVVILQFFRPLSQVGTYVVAQIVAELTISLSTSFQGVLPIVSS